MAFRLSIHSLENVVRLLVPFYGVACPIAVYSDDERGTMIARSTLGGIDGWTPPHQSLTLVIG